MWWVWWVLGVCVCVWVWSVVRPTKEKNGGSLDAYIDEDQGQADGQSSSDDPYKRTFLSPGKLLLVLYGTEYGFSEQVAKKLFDELLKVDEFQPRLVNMSDFAEVDFSREQVVLAICSTSGDGVPPSESRPFFDWLSATQLDLSHALTSVLALGDSAYPHFCRAGNTLHERLGELKAQVLTPKVNVDLEDWEVIDRWIEACVSGLQQTPLEIRDDYLDVQSIGKESQGPSRKQPFFGGMVVRRGLTREGDDKEVIHCEFDLRGSGLTYTSGDALGILPLNNPPEVSFLLSSLASSLASKVVSLPKDCYAPVPDTMTLREALTRYYDLKHVRPELLKLLAERATDPAERKKGEPLLAGGLSLKDNEPLAEYLKGREVGDVLADFASASATLSSAELLSHLRLLQPRYYSISSSPSSFATPCEKVSVTAAVVRYHTHSLPRTGVCTTYLNDRLKIGENCALFISKNPDFRLPSSPSTPIIMIGPGTGIAPFRAFLQERTAPSAPPSKNTLYFGCRYRDVDFLYADELQKIEAEGKLTLRVAFSREQSQKVYVQHLIEQDAEPIWAQVAEGAHIYVCGDAQYMARDVEDALLRIFEKQGGLGQAEAKALLASLEGAHRYQRDVWVT